MSLIQLFAGLIAVLAGIVGWQMYRYPGGWKFAFSEAHDEDRQDLYAARSALRSLKVKAGTDLASARARLAWAEQTHRQRVDRAHRELNALLTTDRGEQLATLGPLSLYERELHIGTEQLPLAGIAAHCEPARSGKKAYLYVTHSDGQSELHPVDTDDPEEAVRQFSIRLQNAIAAGSKLRKQRSRAIKKAEEALETVRADTAAVDSARQEVDAIATKHREDTRVKTAQADLEAARDRWEKTTGRRPR
ncbi:hypothetical protein ACFC1D_01250 [Streptomyces vinaceus]|uniref:hypothetical protein n=1 Tax=Streptomyces vinaceus TaxID=1960 RepID=UPI0035DFBBA0